MQGAVAAGDDEQIGVGEALGQAIAERPRLLASRGDDIHLRPAGDEGPHALGDALAAAAAGGRVVQDHGAHGREGTSGGGRAHRGRGYRRIPLASATRLMGMMASASAPVVLSRTVTLRL